jgi:hypothetical protein
LKSIETLVHDIYEIVDKGVEVPRELTEEFAKDLAEIVTERLSAKPREPYLRLSNAGSKCDRRLYFEIKHPEVLEGLSPETKLKFLIGDLHEAILLFLAKAAGHSVTGEQDTIVLEGVVGHRDAVIDGVTADVKSASSRSFQKFKAGLTPETDSFGYLVQINSYAEGSLDDPLVLDKDRVAFLASDKTLGKLHVDIHQKDPTLDVRAILNEKKEILSRDELPPRAFSDEPDGKSGNRKLGTYCSYCPAKFACWPELRTYLYSNGPRYLTKVVREPKVAGVNDEPF